MLVSNVNFHIMLPVWYEVARFTTEVWAVWSKSLFDVKSPHWKHLKNALDTRFKLLCLYLMWNICKILYVDTEFKLPFLFLMWTFTSYFQFDMKAHVSQLKCELSDYILFLMWSHHTGNTWKILWIQDLNFQACF